MGIALDGDIEDRLAFSRKSRSLPSEKIYASDKKTF
jgi:hypothetical protein